MISGLQGTENHSFTSFRNSVVLGYHHHWHLTSSCCCCCSLRSWSGCKHYDLQLNCFNGGCSRRQQRRSYQAPVCLDTVCIRVLPWATFCTINRSRRCEETFLKSCIKLWTVQGLTWSVSFGHLTSATIFFGHLPPQVLNSRPLRFKTPKKGLENFMKKMLRMVKYHRLPLSTLAKEYAGILCRHSMPAS